MADGEIKIAGDIIEELTKDLTVVTKLIVVTDLMAIMELNRETLSSKAILGTTSDSSEAYSYGRRHRFFLVTHSNLRMFFRRHEIK